MRRPSAALVFKALRLLQRVKLIKTKMQKPAKTFADYLVVAISPVLIMLLVGSLAFFLIQVFYRGEMVSGVRWVMFWFVLAIVLVGRIGIEQSKEHAAVYGIALAIVTWIYLLYSHSAPIFGGILLAITWWCAHKLTVDCTFIKEEEDTSGEGVLQNLWRVVEKSLQERDPLDPRPSSPGHPSLPKLPPGMALPRRPKPARPPGRWVVYFSLLALPLFGIGQLFLPADPEARRTGFEFLAVYLAAALSLLITTSFLGMRRYLRQRFVEMATPIAVGWVRFGVLLAAAVLIVALVLPRPGAKSAWARLTYHISHKQHHASPHALAFNAPGEGNGAPSDHPTEHTSSSTDSHNGTAAGGSQNTQNPANQSTTPGQSGQSGQAGSGGQSGQGGQSGGGGSGGSSASGGSGNNGGSHPAVPQSSGGAPGGNHSPNGGDSGSGNGNMQGNDDGKDPAPPNGNAQHDSGQYGSDSQSEKPPQQNQNVGHQQPVQQAGQQPGSSGGGNNSAPGNGNGNGNGSGQSGNPSQPQPTPASKPNVAPQQQPTPQPQQKPMPKERHHIDWQRLLWILFLLAIASLLVWVAVRYRQVIAHAFRSFAAAVREFFRKLFSFRRRQPAAAPEEVLLPAAPPRPFSTFENPFLTGKDKSWPPKRLILYTYEAIRSWAKDQRIEIKPQETPREFCMRLAGQFPDFAPDLERFSQLYGYAAFADELPDDYDPEPIHFLWMYMGDSVMAISAD